MEEDWLDRIRHHEESLSRAETSLLRFVNENPEQVALLSQKDLAAAADVSKPVVISLFRKLHYESHREFQRAVEEFFSTHIDSYRASLRIRGQVDSLESLIDEALRVDIRSMERLRQSISPDVLRYFVGKVREGARIWIMGPGTAQYPAHFLAQRLRRYGIVSILVGQDTTHHLDELFPVAQTDLLLALHYADSDDWLRPVLRFAGERGCARMVISATIHPRYVAESEEFVHVPRGEVHFKNSMAVPMAFVNLLLLAVEITQGEEVRERLMNLETAREDWETVLREST